MNNKQSMSNKIGGKAIIVVGARGKGKSTFIKTCLHGVKRVLIYDVNGEYSESVNEPLLSFQEFVAKASQAVKTIIVFEEATIFIGHSSSSETLREILVRARHTENTIFLVFHSLRSVPRFIYDLCSDVVLHQTNDNPDFIMKRFENKALLTAFNTIQKQPPGKYPKFPHARIRLQ